MSYKILNTLAEIKEVCDNLKGNSEKISYIGLDTETTALNPYLGKLRLIQLSDGIECYIIDCFKFNLSDISENLREILTDPHTIKIGHNLKFDYQWIYKHLGIRLKSIYCTMAADCVIEFRKQRGWHSLEGNAWKYLNKKLDKSMQKSDWSLPILSPRQLQYAANDVLLLPTLRQEQIKHIKRTQQIEPVRLELKVLPVVAEMELAGLKLDLAYHARLIDVISKERDEAEKQLNSFLDSRLNTKTTYNYDIFGNLIETVNQDTLNIRSSAQLLDSFHKLGINLESTNADDVKVAMAKHPELKYLLDFRNKEKIVSTYGQALQECINPVTGRIHANIKQYGADTSRFAVDSPSLQNQPKKKEFRECYRPEKGKVLIISDLAQIEMRIAANESGDTLLLKVFEDGLDPYSMTASKVFNIPYENFDKKSPDYEKIYKPKRDIGKTLMLGILYGLSWIGLIPRLEIQGIHITEEEAQEYIKAFYLAYPQLAKMLYDREAEALRNRCIRNAAGYRFPLNYNSDDGKQVSSVKNKGRNTPVQSLCGVILKEGIYSIHNKFLELGLEEAFICMVVHDEVLVECLEKDKHLVKDIVEECMLAAQRKYLKVVRTIIDATICESWADKE